MLDRHRVAFAVYLLIERDSEILLLRRANSGWNDGKYTLVAGHVDAGESARTAMVREAAEEVGISLGQEDLDLVHTMYRNDRDPYVDLYFRATRWSGEPRIMEPDKAGDLRWFPVGSLPSELVSTVRSALSCIQSGNIYSEDGW